MKHELQNISVYTVAIDAETHYVLKADIIRFLYADSHFLKTLEELNNA